MILVMAHRNDFPLYTEAIKFFNHEEGMIRIAVRTLTLNVYRVEDEAMRKYILNSTAVPYFSNIVWFIRQQCHTLDRI
jgi:protein CLEC16A